MRRLLLLVAAILAAAGWYFFGRVQGAESWLGYAEADYVKVAPTLEGQLVSLSVARGDSVASGAPLFAQDPVNDRAAVAQARAELAGALEKLADLKAAGRDMEILQAKAEIADMQAAYDRVARDLARNAAIVGSGAATRQTVDQLRDDTASAKARLDAARAKLALIADTTGRAHAIAAQTAAVESARAALTQAQWRLDQRTMLAPASGRIADTYAKPGEMIAAGVPVLSLLPPQNIFVRFFVPESDLARLHAGTQVGIRCDSCPPGLTAKISFIATQSEYTPPVIYSQGTRGSLVYLIEAYPDPSQRVLLKPGQPVDVLPNPGIPP